MRTPRDDDVLGALGRSVVESHYGYAPGRASFQHVYAQLCLDGFPRGERTRAAARQRLGRLVADGHVRQVTVVEPAGATSDDWYEPVALPS
ncbi:MAG TPA: hypothetical protein VGM69_13375 [Chloroflexota bacterium]|jgi:hypothetical protein